MTVIVGYVGSNGAVMASDSHAAEEDATTGVADKIWENGGMLFGYSGHVAVREPLKRAVAKAFEATPPPPKCPIELAESSLCATLRPVLAGIYANFVGAPDDDPAEKLGGSLMVIGYDDDAYWLLEISRNNIGEYYTEDGFHTIGTGSLAGHVSRGLLKHYSLPGYEVQHLRLLAYRTVSTCIDVLGGAYMLGGPVQLWNSIDGGGFAKVSGQEFDSVQEGLEQWVGIEQESLSRVLADREAVTPPQESEPLPERLDEQDEGSRVG